ncbi:MAG: phosphate ABC transporter permease subunit PstC, partial [Promethearchaeota archaeon]
MKNPQESQNYAEIIQKIKKSKTKPFHQPVVGIILTLAGIFSIIAVFIIILFLARESVWFTKNPEGWTILDMLFTNDWHPERVLYTGEGREPTYGAIFIIIGSLLITIGAMMFAVPLGIGCAIFISEIAPPKLRVFLKTGIELLAGIPSIVYGFIGLRVFTPFLQNILPNRRLLGFTGDSWLAASILLGIMALPTIVSVTEDSLRAVPREYKEASLAMGATKWQTIRRVQVPSAISGITAAVILGMGRAIGETMAVMFVAGNSLAVPEFGAGNWWNSWGILERLRTITATLGIELKEVPWNTPWYGALFMLGVILFVITLIINTLSSVFLKKINERFQPPAKDDDLDKEALGNIAYSVAYLPKSIKNRRVDGNHGLSSPEIDKIKHSFKKLGETMRYFGFF